MRMRPECVPCLLNRVRYEGELVNPKLTDKAMQEALKIMSEEYSGEANSVKVATKIHRRTYQVLGDMDPYREVKLRSNKVALKLLPRVEERVEKAEDKLQAAITCAIVGNLLDFGIQDAYESPEKLLGEFDKFYSLEVNEVGRIKKYLRRGNKILVFLDNCGEIVFDRLLCKVLKELGVVLSVVVKGKPIITDATVKEALALGFDKIADEILSTKSNAVGVDFDEIDEELMRRIESADLIVCKGMALYESFCETDYKPIAYLLRAKCTPVAEDMKVPKGVNVAMVYE